MNFGHTFMRAKQNLFNTLGYDANAGPTNTAWKVKYFGTSPIAATLREFTEAEKADKMNNNLKGVRTYFF
jgi:hypothetical protein